MQLSDYSQPLHHSVRGSTLTWVPEEGLTSSQGVRAEVVRAGTLGGKGPITFMRISGIDGSWYGALLCVANIGNQGSSTGCFPFFSSSLVVRINEHADP